MFVTENITHNPSWSNLSVVVTENFVQCKEKLASKEKALSKLGKVSQKNVTVNNRQFDQVRLCKVWLGVSAHFVLSANCPQFRKNIKITCS